MPPQDKVQKLQSTVATMFKQLKDLHTEAVELAEQDPEMPELTDRLRSVRIQIEAVTAELEALRKRLDQPN
jgi:hypothetical protein